MKQQKLIVNSFVYAIGEILPKALTFLLFPVLTRYLSPDDYGMISYTTSVTILFGFIGSLSLNSYVLRFYFDVCESEKETIVGTAFIATGFFNFTLTLISFLIFPYIIGNYNIQVPWDPYFKYAILSFFFNSFGSIPLVLYRVRQQAFMYVILTIVKSLLTIILNLYYVVYLKEGVLGYFFSTLIISIPFCFIYIAIIWKNNAFKFSFKRLKQGLNYSLPLVPGAISYFVFSLSDRMILERYEPLAVIGIYNIAASISNVLSIAIQGGYRSFEPEIYKRYNTNHFSEYIHKLHNLYFFIIVLFSTIITIFSFEIFALMSSKVYWDGRFYIPTLIAGVALSGHNVFYQCLLAAEKRSYLSGSITLLGAIVSFTFNFFLIPVWGAYAASVSYMVSYIVMNVILYYKVRYKNKNLIKDLIPLSLIVVSSLLINDFLCTIDILSFGCKLILAIGFIVLFIHIYKINYILKQYQSHV